jgi:signal transduction histidine kinase
MFTEMPVGLLLLDARTLRILRVNDRACLPPFDRYDLRPGCTLDECVRSMPRIGTDVFNRVGAGEVVARDYVRMQRHERTWYFNFLFRPIRGPEGDIDWILVSVADVTASETRRRRLQAILDLLPDAVLIADAAGRSVMVNQAILELPVDLPLEKTPLARALAGTTVRGTELQIKAHDGRELTLLINAVPLQDPKGLVSGALLTLADVTEMKRNQALKDEFLSIASHELRTPISTAKIFLALAAEQLGAGESGPPDARSVAKQLAAVDQQLDRLCRLCDELVDVTRLDHSRLRLETKIHRVEDVVAAAIEGLHHVVAPRRLKLLRLSSERAAPMHANLDEDRIEQVLSNLLSNAGQHSAPDSTIEVSVMRGKRVGGRDCAVVSVRDEGTGIAAEALSRIFDRYYSLDQKRRDPDQRRVGLGLGLYIARQIVEGHGGTIWATSEAGRGTTLSFSLPLADPSVLLR